MYRFPYWFAVALLLLNLLAPASAPASAGDASLASDTSAAANLRASASVEPPPAESPALSPVPREGSTHRALGGTSDGAAEGLLIEDGARVPAEIPTSVNENGPALHPVNPVNPV